MKSLHFFQVALVIVLVFCGVISAHAATFTVTTLSDDSSSGCTVSNCTLRQAIVAANAASSTDTINFQSGLTGALSLTSALPGIAGSVTINGPTTGNISVGHTSGAFYRVFTVNSGTVTIENLQIVGGDVNGMGGGVYNAGQLTLLNCLLSGNEAETSNQNNNGGAVYSIGDLSIYNSTISSNTAVNGGGIYTVGGTLTIQASTIDDNFATDLGLNTSVTGIGGGICVNGTKLVVNSSTLYNNHATSGAGLLSSNTLSGTTSTLNNCTFASNSATGSGGAIFNSNGLLALDSCTITNNAAVNHGGSGIGANGNSATKTQLTNTIVAGNANTDIDYPDSTTNSYVSLGHNLIGLGNAVSKFVASGDQVIGSNSPGLWSIGNNGGATQTIALKTNSPALNRGATTLTVDQRNIARPQGTRADVGAYEYSDFVESTVVDTLADEDDGTTDYRFGIGTSLREAINYANLHSGTTITFSPDLSGTISLGSQLPDITKTVAINGLARGGISISGVSNTRLFNITPTGNLTLRNLTLTSGSGKGSPGTGNGGAIYTNGTLLLDSCTLAGNSATQGGAIYSSTTLTGLTTTIVNCTFRGNSAATNGGALFNHNGLTVIQNSTISINASDSNHGSGIASFGDTATLTRLQNSIVAANVNTDLDFVIGATNSFQSNSYNLVGDGNGPAAFTATGDQKIGNGSPGLIDLASNGGPTKTMALQPSSPAINKGDPGFAGTGKMDQRGTGYARVSGGRLDIGAFEHQSSHAPVNVSLSPNSLASPAGTAQSFTATYSDADGSSDFKNAYIQVRTTPGGTTALYATYDAVNNKLYLQNDGNTAALGGFAPGSNNVISNSQGSINCAATTVTRRGNDLVINWSLTRSAVYIGLKNVYLYCSDLANATDGFDDMGDWLIKGTSNVAPTNVSVTPSSLSSGVGVPKSLTAVYTDGDSAADFKTAYIQIRTTSGGTNALYATYDAVANKLYLQNDANSAALGGITPGSNTVISNSQGSLNCAATTVTRSGNTLTINWNFTPSASYTGLKNVYLYCRDTSNASDGFDDLGDWNITESAPARANFTTSSGTAS